MNASLPFWIGFHVAVVLLVVLDLFVLRRKGQSVSLREAAFWSVVWVILSLSFGAYIYRAQGHERGVEFFTGYLVEYSLSMDNLFVFMMIFAHFKIGHRHQHKVLVWGILGALAMRGAMIALGVQLIRSFGWILYAFGFFLLVTGVRMAFEKKEEEEKENGVFRLIRKIPWATPEFHGEKFLVRSAAGWLLTPLALALIVVDIMDVAFAVDSIPAVFAVTRDPFIVYTSNICAIMGLRSLYFLLAGVADRFKKLHYGLAAVLCFIGAKMLLAAWVHISNPVSLLVVGVMLAASMLWSLFA